MHVISAEKWWPCALDHFHQARKRSRARVERRRRGTKNPLEDFLWEYYPLRPGRLAVWHPGFAPDGEPYGLAQPDDYSASVSPWNPARDEEPTPSSWWAHHATLSHHCMRDGVVAVADDFLEHRAHGINYLSTLNTLLLERTPVFGCMGWHEWAMVYHADETRHALPLRLGATRTDELVEQAHIRCTHFDAFRFFEPEAMPMNKVQPSYETVLENEQPGCIHVSMDLLRTCIQLGPIIPGELTIRAFDLALQARTIDMAASPYDCSSLGVKAIPIETAAGKSEYLARQQELTEQARPLRQKLLNLLTPLRDKLAQDHSTSKPHIESTE